MKKIKNRILGFFITHPWLKVISLVLAVLIWVFVKEEINKFNY